MINISRFIKENAFLCVYILGLAIFGCLGPYAYANRISDLEISQDKITMGQGEYIVFHRLPTGEEQSLSRETFEKVYQILLRYSPAAIVNNEPEDAAQVCVNRYEIIRAKLKEVDPTLEAVFIPRTLYELIFIRQCIQEDLKNKKICPFLSYSKHCDSVEKLEEICEGHEVYLQKKEVERRAKKCWHLCFFLDVGNDEDIGVKKVAYRLNKVIFKAFNPPNEGFTHQEFSAFAEQEIKFLKAHYKNGLKTLKKLRKGKKVEEISSCCTPGPTTNFGFESTKGAITPMGVRNEIDAQIIRNAIALDCSKIAQHSLFLYRGADFQKDSTSCWEDKNTPYSLSYGSGLFAGCLYDGGATAFYYMRNKLNAYAIPVDFDQLNKSPFFIPTTHPIAQLYGCGEIFHARTKAWKDFDVKDIGGINYGGNGHIRGHLISDLSQVELSNQFEAYKNKALQLK